MTFTIDGNGKHVWTDIVTNEDTSLNSQKVLEYCIPTRGGFPKVMSLEAWMSVDAVGDEAKDALDKNWSADKDLIAATLTIPSENAEEYMRIMNDVQTAAAETFLSVIIGNKDESAIDELFATVDTMGIDRAIEIYQEAYDEYQTR